MALTSPSALLALACLAIYAATHAHAATDQANLEQEAAAVKATCRNSSFSGEEFYMGARLLNSVMANDVAGCCALCTAEPNCTIWTYCPLSTQECQVPIGPFVNVNLPPGMCILSTPLLQPNSSIELSWSYRQPGVVWKAGLKSSSFPFQSFTTATSSEQNAEFMFIRDERFYCRKVTGGNLQLTALAGNLFTEPTVSIGDKVAYTGLTVRDQQSARWGIIYDNNTRWFWRYPAAYLGPCDEPDSVCTPGSSGGRSEEGTSCEETADCCSDMICIPRVNAVPGTLLQMALGTSPADRTKQPVGRPFAIEPNSTDGLSVLPGECSPLGREFLLTAWVFAPFNGSASAGSPNATCVLRSDATWVQGDTWNSSAPTNFTDSNPVPWETWAAQLCQNLSTAGSLIADSFMKGGVEAARAFNATTYSCGTSGLNLLEVFYNYANPPFIGQWDVAEEYAAAYIAAANLNGAAACVTLAEETRNGTLLQQVQLHTLADNSPTKPTPPPPPAPGPGPAPQPSPSSSSTGVIVAVVVSVVAACAVSALAAFYIVRRRRRQRLADAEHKGSGSIPQAMGKGELDDFLNTSGFANTHTGTPTPVTTSGTSAAAGTSGGQAGTPSTRSRDHVLSAIASAQAQGSAPLSGRLASEGATPVSPRRGSSGLDARPWEIRFEELKVIRAVGEGSYGKVYLGAWHETAVAVKILLGSTIVNSQREAEQALEAARKMVGQLDTEAGLMASLRHPNCVPFFAVCHNPPCIVTEYCSRGGLDSVLAEARRDPVAAAQLTWTRRLSLVLDAARGMLYLHQRSVPVLHRDLKSPNILVDEDWHAKVADFNLSRIMEDPSRSSSLTAMNPRWLAPEVMQGAHASKASDVYSFGIVMWEVLTLQLPFTSGMQGPWQIVSFIINGGRPEVPPREQLPGSDTLQFEGLPAYINLMQRCWVQDPEARPNFATIAAELKSLLISILSSDDLASPTYRHLLSERPSGEAVLRSSGGSGTSAPATVARGSGNSTMQSSSDSRHEPGSA